MNAFPTLFISHGAPTLAIEPGQIGPRLAALAKDLPRPRAILVASAHWFSRGVEVMTHPRPVTVHDFGGFPPELYRIRYPAPGAPDVAREVIAELRNAGIAARGNDQQGFDHGTWVPLLHMYPGADIPVIQISLGAHDGPEETFRLGQALAAIRNRGVLVIGSGSLTHNLHEFRIGVTAVAPYIGEFSGWIRQTLQQNDLESLLDYRRRAPHAVRAHPTEDHLLPLFFALGAAGDQRGDVRRIDGGISYGILSMDAFEYGSGVKPQSFSPKTSSDSGAIHA
jgi:4,5-DOPA dioxygenase extradiol